MAGTFEDFLDALLAYESGWDRERYDAGIITDEQLDTWAGGSVQDFYPDYSSWSELTDEEWETMAYRSMNSYGFVGYQFGEPFLIDLGYYDDDEYYGNGASTNTWDGTWTGKNGVDSLEEFMTQEAQDVAIRETFGFNLQTIEEGLAAEGKSLDDYLGTTVTYGSGDSAVTVELTLTGILAGAHLSGAPAVISLLLNGTLANDEYGTSILQYIDQFGGYDSPEIEELIEYFEERLTGDEGLNNDDNGTANVTADTADVVIDWDWGTNAVISDFDPETDTIYIGWFTSDHIDVSESNGNVVFTISSNNQTVTLEGVSLSDLTAANFTIMDDTAAEEILSQVSEEDSSDDDTDDTDSGDTDTGDTDDGDTDTDDTDTDDTSTGDGIQDTVQLTWNWGAEEVISDFSPSEDVLDFGSLSSNLVDISEVDGDLQIEILGNGGHTYIIEDVQAEDLSLENLAAASWNGGVLNDQDGVIDQLEVLGNDEIA
jgi:uncharacterized protein YuzE